MITRKVTLGGVLPFSPTRAQTLVELANSFVCNIILQDSRGTFNGKSMLGMLSLGKLSGREMLLLAEGRDAQRAVDELALSLEAEA
ncbi:MAG: HPr family phosphocarrier protein [Clostridiales bacterium]|nr:HPr family phosphocarrier protein [Clostridiales bacterium]